MSRLIKLWMILILAVPSATILALHGYLGSFTRLMADDYCTLYNMTTRGFLGTALHWYRTWAGVYARSLINEVLVLVGPYNMHVIVPVFLILWLVATAWVIYLVMEGEYPIKIRFWVSIGWSLTFISAVLITSPQVTQSLYWWGGMSAYTTPLILATIYAGITLSVSRKVLSRNARITLNTLSFLFAFGLGGISESFTPTLVIAILLTIGWGLLLKRKNLPTSHQGFLAAGLLGSLLALITMIAAPGNVIRQAFFPSHPNVFDVIRIASAGYLDFLRALIVQPQILTGILGSYLVSVTVGMNTTDKKPVSIITAPVILILGFFFAFLCFPPAVYGTSEIPPERVLVITAFFLAAGFIGSGFAGGKWLSYRVQEPFHRLLTPLVMATATLLVVFSSWTTSQTLYHDRYNYIEFADKWDQVDIQIRHAKTNGADIILIPAMDNWARLERPNDNKRYWVNKCYSAFYGIQIYGPEYSE